MVIKGMATWLSSTEAGQQAGDRDLAAGHVDVEFVPGPGHFVALAVFLAADFAGEGQVGEHLAEVLHDLQHETRWLRLRPLFILAWTSALARRGRIGCRGIVFAVVGLILDRLLARFDRYSVASRSIAPMMRPRGRARSGPLDLVWQLAARNSAYARETWRRKELASWLACRGDGAAACRYRGARSGRLVVGWPGPPWPVSSASARRPRAAGPGPCAARERRLRGRSRRGWLETARRFGDRVDILTH